LEADYTDDSAEAFSLPASFTGSHQYLSNKSCGLSGWHLLDGLGNLISWSPQHAILKLKKDTPGTSTSSTHPTPTVTASEGISHLLATGNYDDTHRHEKRKLTTGKRWKKIMIQKAKARPKKIVFMRNIFHDSQNLRYEGSLCFPFILLPL